MTVHDPTRPTYREVFAQPVFRILFGANLAAVVAGTLRTVALAFLVYDATGSRFLTAMAYGITFAPQALGGIMLGALPDRARPRRLIAAGYLAECTVGMAVATPSLPVDADLALLAGLGLLLPACNGASARVIAGMLRGDGYVLARSLSSLAVSGGQLVGLAAGGLVVGVIGPRRALLVAAGCHLIAAVAVHVGLPDLPSGARGPSSVLRQGWSGTRQLIADAQLRPLFVMQWLPPMFIAGVEALIVPYGQYRGFPAAVIGLLLACFPVGMMVGDVCMGRLVSFPLRTRLVLPLMSLVGLTFIPFVFDPSPATCGSLLFAAGVGNAYMLGVQGRFRDTAPTELLGQSFALLGTGLMVLQGLGPMLFGAVSEVARFGVTIAIAGTAILVVTLTVTSRWRTAAVAPPSTSKH